MTLGTCSYHGHTRPHIITAQCRNWTEQHALSDFTGESFENRPDRVLQRQVDKVRELEKQLLAAQQEAGMWRDKYDHLSVVYNKLADQWNAFQATARPDNRNVQRAEAAGELARKLGEVLLALAYDKDARQLITDLLSELHHAQQPATGQEVEVGGKLVKHRG